MNRRQLLAHISAALACSHIPTWALAASAPVIPITPSGAKAHLDLTAAQIIREQFLASEEHHPNYDVLGEDMDLTAYSTASIDALECLKPLIGGFATLGFTAVSPEMAKVLGDWKTHFLCFTHLQSLEFEAASCLGSAESGHGLVFEWPMALDEATLRALAGNGAPLSLHLRPAPDMDCAVALATHTHELYLTCPSVVIGPQVWSALILHAGYSFKLNRTDWPD
jgi:hypothetical protein